MANNRRRLIGRVVSNKMEKTVVVSIEINKQHRIYKKVMRTSKKVYAHDESNAIPLGSLVRLVESKPLSKLKRWVVEEVLQDTTGKVLEPIAGDITEEPLEEAENDSE
jgi:small subunit ribosomal protein S17